MPPLPPLFPLLPGTQVPSPEAAAALEAWFAHANGWAWQDHTEAFASIAGAVDLALLERVRIIQIGVGRAASFTELLARLGIGEIVLIDPDQVEHRNLASQPWYLPDVGHAKVEVLARRIHTGINPNCRVRGIVAPLEALDDTTLEDLLFGSFIAAVGLDDQGSPYATPRPPTTSLLLGLTDRFAPQARVNALSLHLGVPSLTAGLYHQGRAGEIVFQLPGHSPACMRCITRSRYAHYLKHPEHAQQPTSSHNAPPSALPSLHGLMAYLVLAILHHGSDHPLFGGLLEQLDSRQLVQLRLDANTGPLELTTFDERFGPAGFMGEPLYYRVKPDPNCPDCGGSGNLLAAKGTFTDTRTIRQAAAQPGSALSSVVAAWDRAGGPP